MEARVPKQMSLEGNVAENYKRFKQHFMFYLMAAGHADKSDETKVAILLNIMGEECIDIFNNFKLTDEEKKKFDKVITEFDSYMSPKTNLIYKRFNFYSRSQESGEPVEHFVTEIRKLAKSCKFQKEEEMIRDRLVLGIRNKAVQEKILTMDKPELTKVVEMCRASELLKEQMKNLAEDKEISVNEVKSTQQTSGRNSDERKQNFWKKENVKPKEEGRERNFNCTRCRTTINKDTRVFVTFCIPQRWILGIMGFLAVFNAYTMRICLSLAMTHMVYIPTANSTSHHTREEVYDWDMKTQGLLKSAFYYGYIVTHMPGGLLAERFGGKYTLGLGVLSTSMFTLMTPVVIHVFDWHGLLALRILEGLGEGTTYPALTALLSKWVPLSERARIGTLVYSGAQIGTIVGNGGAGFVINATHRWSSAFYLFGSIGVLWFLCWTLLCYSSPDTHPFITEKEKIFLQNELGHAVSHTVPWKGLLSSAPVWALVGAQIGHDWGFFTMITDLPKYMEDVLKFNIKKNGVWSSVPYIFMWIVSMSSGVLCDYLIKKHYMSITFARKFFTGIAAIGPGIFMLSASYAGTQQVLVIVLFTIAMSFMGTFYCGMKVNSLDLSPNHAGTVMAIVNGVGAITGIFTPMLVGLIVTNNTLEEWRIVFWVAMGVFILTTLTYLWFGSGEMQWWNDVSTTGNEPQSSQKK